MHEVPTFEEECRKLRGEGWTIAEIADFVEHDQNAVRKALGLAVAAPQDPNDKGLLPYLGMGDF